jgi:uncharacterized protein (DUF1330 family)
MPKGYWITFYRSVSNQANLAEYAGIAGAVIVAHGGRILARGNPVKKYEAGLNERVVIIEFDSVNQAIEAYESSEYQAALAILKDSAERDLRIMEGV